MSGRPFVKKEDKFLRENCNIIPAKRMAKMLGRSEATARQRMKLLGITPSEEAIQRFKEQSRFKKGQRSFNTGLKQSDFMSPEAIERTKATRFKKGTPPPTSLYDGAITIRNDKTGRKYKYIRLSAAKWVPLQTYIWKKAGRKIPQGKFLVFKDKNSLNCKLSNLELVTRSENMKRNTYHKYPKPIALAIQLRGALNRQINKHSKRLRNEK